MYPPFFILHDYGKNLHRPEVPIGRRVAAANVLQSQAITVTPLGLLGIVPWIKKCRRVIPPAQLLSLIFFAVNGFFVELFAEQLMYLL